VVWTEGGADGGSADFLSAAMFLFNLLVLMLLSDIFMRVRGVRLENHSDYTACIGSPSTCYQLCVPPRPSPCPPVSCRPGASVLARGNGDRERLDTSPWMAVTVLPSRRSCAGETRVAPGRFFGRSLTCG
jgi:hypothetical protein